MLPSLLVEEGPGVGFLRNVRMIIDNVKALSCGFKIVTSRPNKT